MKKLGTQFANIIGGNFVESVKEKVMKDYFENFLCVKGSKEMCLPNDDQLDPLVC